MLYACSALNNINFTCRSNIYIMMNYQLFRLQSCCKHGILWEAFLQPLPAFLAHCCLPLSIVLEGELQSWGC